MTAITPRAPRIDWNRALARHWNGGDPAATHVFSALSFLFPQGERFFIEVVRDASGRTPITDPALAEAVRAFVAQEATHRQQHAAYNAVLEKQGFRNVVAGYIDWLQKRSTGYSILTRLAIVCAYEHYTAILGDYLLCNPHVLREAPPQMALLWGWHAAEETEHKAVCFDLYRALGGRWQRRALVFLFVTLNFNAMFLRLYASLLHRDRCLRPLRLAPTLAGTARFFFGRTGVAWYLLRDGARYLLPRFHPWHQDNRAELRAWLAANRDGLREIGG